MRLFISWSKGRSKALAEALAQWLPKVLPFIDPWLSQNDIPSGSTWRETLINELCTTDAGIVCLTPENFKTEWLNFEAGALHIRARLRCAGTDGGDKARIFPI